MFSIIAKLVRKIQNDSIEQSKIYNFSDGQTKEQFEEDFEKFVDLLGRTIDEASRTTSNRRAAIYVDKNLYHERIFDKMKPYFKSKGYKVEIAKYSFLSFKVKW